MVLAEAGGMPFGPVASYQSIPRQRRVVHPDSATYVDFDVPAIALWAAVLVEAIALGVSLLVPSGRSREEESVPDPTIRGACVCGAVRYAIQPPFQAFQYCHCSRCRKSSGSAHAANLFVPAAQLVWEAGEVNVQRYELPTAKYWCHCFCSICGSAMPWLTRTGKLYIVPAGTLDDDPGVRPARSVHFASRASWYVHAKDLETFDEEPSRQ